ncbi:MAG: hypothetical protein AB7G93_22200 [Bdellovibrionales bacterium]
MNEKIHAGRASGGAGGADKAHACAQNLPNLPSWLDHSSIETTWKKYPNKERVSFTSNKKAAQFIAAVMSGTNFP